MTSPVPVRQVGILVGGKGTRLGEITRSVPKPLLDIGGGMVFLDFVIEQVARQGFDDIILLAGHLGHRVEERYGSRSFATPRVRVVVEPEPRGTGGALLSVRDIVAPRFLLLNGDSFFDTNLRALAAHAATADCEALLALCRVPDGSRYGAVSIAGDHIVGFREKDITNIGPALINAGAYALSSAVIDRVHSLPCSIETEIFPRLAIEGKLFGAVRDGYFLDIGLPETLDQSRRELSALRRRPAAFLDRDGVINVDNRYVHRPDQFDWVPGAQDAVRLLNDLGYRVVVVTNQAGIGYGYYDEESMYALHRWLQDRLAAEGAFIDAFYHCPYHPQARLERFRVAHIDRKPGPGMILRAFSDLQIDKDRSFLIGDKESDIEAARRAGIPGFLFSGGNLATFLKNRLGGLASDSERRRSPSVSEQPGS
jgi:D,D-heptose 1,7-bisphosphate phosphatase